MNVVTENTTLEIVRRFDAPAARVFNAGLNREEWQSWIGPEGMACQVPVLEPHIGGRYRITMRLSDGRVIPVTGIFKQIDAPRRLVFTWGWEGDPKRESLITISLLEIDGQTELTLRQEGLGSSSNRDDHGKGWRSAFTKLEGYLARIAS